MSIYKKRSNRKLDVIVNGISSKTFSTERLYDGLGRLPSDSELEGRELLDYVASIINYVENASDTQLRSFDSDLIRLSDGYGDKNWDLTDVYNKNVVTAYQPLLDYLLGKNNNYRTILDTNGGLRPGRYREHYNLVITDSDGQLTTKNVFNVFQQYMPQWMEWDFWARKAIAQNVLTAISEDSDLEDTITVSVLAALQDIGGLKIPIGTTAERPPDEAGFIRYNSDLTAFEGYNGAAWASLGGVMDVDQDTYILPELAPTTDEDELVFFTGGTQALTINTAGDLVAHSGVTGGWIVPTGTTAERPANNIGTIRFNSSNQAFEGYNGAAWASLGGVMDVDQDTYILPESAPTADEDFLTFVTAGIQRMEINAAGNVKMTDLAGTGQRYVTVAADGTLSTANATADIGLLIKDENGTILKTIYAQTS